MTVIALAVAIPSRRPRPRTAAFLPHHVTGGLVLGLVWLGVVTRLVLLAPINAAGDVARKAKETITR